MNAIAIDAITVSFVSALTALAASVIAPFVTMHVAHRQFNSTVLSANRQRWIEGLRLGQHEVLLRHPQLGERRETVLVTMRQPARLGVDLRRQ